MKSWDTYITLISQFILLITIFSCSPPKQSPLNQTGKGIDRGLEKIGDNLEELGDNIEDTLEKADEDIQKTFDEQKKDIDDISQ